jgi:glutamate-1-semialdehyde aminotransferase
MANTVRFNENDPDITESNALYERALGLIPALTQTLAKGPGQHVAGVAPKYVARGRGSHVWDVDGNEFIDYTMGVGPLSLGYCYPAVDDAIRRQLEDGITFSLVHPLEVEVAELIRSVVPNAESVRYSKTGCDVTSAAVRLARAYTGRDTVLCCGYHGWHDWYIGVTDRNAGIPQATRDLTYTFNYNDMQSVLDAIDDDTACIILEPFVFEPPRDNFLRRLRSLCDERGIVLIFDEMWTGFRVALGGAQEYFGVDADLMCYSKAVANGMPLSILAGRRHIMELLDRDVFFFTTFGGEALSLAAARATIAEIRDRNVPAHLARLGGMLRDGYNAIAAESGAPFTRCAGFECRTIVTFDASAGDPLIMKSFVQQELIRRGILWSGFHTMSFSHTDDDVAYTLAAYRDVLPMLAAAVSAGDVSARLRGAPVEPVFRRTGNFNMKPRAAKEPGAVSLAE